MERIELRSERRSQLIDVTGLVAAVVSAAGLERGVCRLHVPHTTAAVTLNENADPDVPRDILATLSRLVPEDGGYAHSEGNSDAHLKSSLVGAGLTLLVEGGRLQLGRWQAVFFCEFDGPRQRELWVRLDPV